MRRASGGGSTTSRTMSAPWPGDHGPGCQRVVQGGAVGRARAAAERLKVSLDQLWGEAAGFDTDRLQGFLDTLGPASPAVVRDIHFDGHLKRRARRARRKAGGLDGWTGELVAVLLLGFFDKLVRLWTAIVEGGRVPWDGSRSAWQAYRSLMVASALWP